MSETDILTIDLVRHARSRANLTDTYCNDRDDPLDAAAFDDIARLRECLAPVDYVACHTSPYRRCTETATGLLGSRAITPVTDDSLREMEHGPWNSLTNAEVRRTYPDQWKSWSTAPDSAEVPGRETLAAVKLRALEWIDRVTGATSHGAVLAVSHVIVLRVLVAAQLGMPMSEVRNIEVPNLALFRLEPNRTSSAVWQLHLPPNNY
jgi:probable phosphoglycerate mutase